VQIALGAAERRRDLIDAELRIAQMFADEELSPNIHRLGAATVEHRVGLAKRQQQEIDQRIGDADGIVRRQRGGFVKHSIQEVVGDASGAGACRKFTC
jgi:hypothetical protein